MDLSKLPYLEDGWKLKFDIEKCKVQYNGSNNIKDEYKLSKKDIKKVIDESDLGVGFDVTFKSDNHILFIVSRANGIIGWMVRNLFQGR